MKRLILITFLIIAVNSSVVCATSDVVVRVKGEPASPWVGQKVIFTIDVLAKDGWATINTLPLIEVPGAYLHRYETQGTRLNENIDGASYTGQRYELLLFAQSAGELTIDSFPVEVSVKSWGADAATKVEKLSTEPVQLSVLMPEGISPSDYMPATEKLEATQSWSSDSTEYKAGDAIERTVTRKAEDVSAMVFPPFAKIDIEGMTCYPDQPEVDDTFNRGVLTGARIDRSSCIFEREGEFVLPDIEVSYWKVSEEKLETITLRGNKFTVKGGGQEHSASTGALSTKAGNHLWWYLLILAALLCAVLFYFRNGLSAFFRKLREERHNSEQFLFARVEGTAKNGNKEKLLSAIMSWLDRLPGLAQPARLEEFAGKIGDEKLASLLLELSQKPKWTVEECQSLKKELQRGRKTYLHATLKETDRSIGLPSVGLSD